MSNTLVGPDDLYAYPGAPYADSLLDGVVAAIRSEVGWHIAPVLTETVTIDARGGVLLMLPTLRLVTVTAVRDVTTPAAPVTLTGWRASAAGMLYREEGWPLGFATLEVDMQHGYASTPADVITAIAERAQTAGTNSALASRSVGPFSETYRSVSEMNTTPLIDRYRLPGVA